MRIRRFQLAARICIIFKWKIYTYSKTYWAHLEFDLTKTHTFHRAFLAFVELFPTKNGHNHCNTGENLRIFSILDDQSGAMMQTFVLIGSKRMLRFVWGMRFSQLTSGSGVVHLLEAREPELVQKHRRSSNHSACRVMHICIYGIVYILFTVTGNY